MGYTVRVSNVSQKATERDIYDFFAFSGEISSIQTKPAGSEAPGTQLAFVTFQDERSLETALLLTGAVIGDRPVTVELADGYVPPPTSAADDYAAASSGPTPAPAPAGNETLKKAENMIATLLAQGYILGKDALEKAKALDEKHEVSATAKVHASSISQSAAELDSRYAISKKLQETGATVSRSLSTMDQKYQVSSKTKEAISAAEASLAEAGQYVMQNKYVSSGTSWLMGALGQLKTIVTEVQQQTAEKVSKAEEEKVGGSSSRGDDDEDRTGGSRKSGETTGASGLADHGPPVGAAPPSSALSSGQTYSGSLLDAPHDAAAPPSAVPKSALSSDPPVF